MKINFVRFSSGKRTSITISDSICKLWFSSRFMADSDSVRSALKVRLENLSDPDEGMTFQQLAENTLVNDICEFQNRLLESKDLLKDRVIDELIPWLQAQVEPESSAKDVLLVISKFKNVKWDIAEKFQSLYSQRF